MYVRLQTWFPFEIQIGINGREWLARQMDRERPEVRTQRQQVSLDRGLAACPAVAGRARQTDWVRELDALQKQVHPLHPRLLGPVRVPYNWTVFQSEWATDVAFQSEAVLQPHFDRWLRQAFLSYDTIDVLRFLGRSERITKQQPLACGNQFLRSFRRQADQTLAG